jgi:hypothetical protein
MPNVYTNYKAVLSTNELSTVYTVPAETTSIIKSIRVSNTDTENDCNISLFLVDSSGSSFGIETDRTVKAKRSAELLATGVLNAKDESTDPNPAFRTPVANSSAERLALTVLSVSIPKLLPLLSTRNNDILQSFSVSVLDTRIDLIIEVVSAGTVYTVLNSFVDSTAL